MCEREREEENVRDCVCVVYKAIRMMYSIKDGYDMGRARAHV